MKRIVLSTIAAALALGSVRNVDANVFTAPAATCVPTNATAHDNNYIISAGTVKFKPGATGTIQFICAIPGTLALPPTHFFILYSNTAGGSTVGATYERMAKSTGLVDPNPHQIATTNKSGSVVVEQNTDTIQTSEYGNFYIYYVQFSAIRLNSTDNPIIYAVGLQ